MDLISVGIFNVVFNVERMVVLFLSRFVIVTVIGDEISVVCSVLSVIGVTTAEVIKFEDSVDAEATNETNQ